MSFWARALSLLLCGTIRLPNAMDLFETEFGGGTLTGPLTVACLAGCTLFILDALLVFWSRRTALAAACAALLCLPLDLYRLAPQSFAWLSTVPYSVAHNTGVTMDVWSLAQLLTIATMAVVHAASPKHRIGPHGSVGEP